MTPLRARPAFAELLAAQTVRRLEGGEPRYYPDIDLRLSREAPRDAAGHLKNPAAVIAERAGEVLETRHGLRTGWIGETVGWLKVARVIGCILALVLAFGAAEPWMSQDQTVNVEWIFGFLTVLIVSMAITVLMLVTAALSRRKSDGTGGVDPGGAATRSLAKLLVVHWLMMFLVRRALPWIQRRILKREKEQTLEQRRSAEKISEAAYDTLSAQSRRLALEAAFTSNLAWLLISIGLFLSLGKMGLFRQYDFRWQATIVSDDFMLQATRALATPIRLLPLVSVPTAEDVHWLTRGEWPQSLNQLVQPEVVAGRQKEPYLAKVPVDPWGNPIQYEFQSGQVKPTIWSWGPNKQEGGGDDISNMDQQNQPQL
jgi:hypothetical protein